MTTPAPWSDERLAAAYAALAAQARTPPDLAGSTSAALLRRATPRTTGHRLAGAAAAVVLAVGMVGGVVILTDGLGFGPSKLVEFRDGPTPDLRTLDAGEFTFDFPADWLAYEAVTAFSGGSSIVVLGTQPVEPRCGDASHVDINCVYEQPLDAGAVRVFVGTGAFRGGTVLDRPDIENGVTRQLEIGGMPAILDVFDPRPDSFYGEDVSINLSIGRPTTLTNVVRIEVLAREWPHRGRINTAAEVEAAMAAVVHSFRFTPPPIPLPADRDAAIAAGWSAIREQAASFRRGYVADGDSRAQTYLDCLGDDPAVTGTARVRYGPGGDLDGLVDLDCTWAIRPETATVWRLDLTYEWSVGGRAGRYVETHWLDAAGTVLAGTFTGDPLPIIEAGTEPTSVARAWPPDGATIVVLTSEVGGGLPPAQVAIDDRSGRITAVREAVPSDAPINDSLGTRTIGFQRDPTVSGRFRLTWVGGVCDGTMTVTIDEPFEAITVDRGPQPPCDAMGVTRHLVLDIAGSLDPATVEMIDAGPSRLPPELGG